jgi:hypothetical protein
VQRVNAYFRTLASRALGEPSPIRPPRLPRLTPLQPPAPDPAGAGGFRPRLEPADDAIFEPPAPAEFRASFAADDPPTPMAAAAPPKPDAPGAGRAFADGSAEGRSAEAARHRESPERTPALPSTHPERGDIAETRISSRPITSVAELRTTQPVPVLATPPTAATSGADASLEVSADTYIHIGRVELHATPPAAPPRRAAARPTHQPMPLDEYLRRRAGKPR